MRGKRTISSVHIGQTRGSLLVDIVESSEGTGEAVTARWAGESLLGGTGGFRAVAVPRTRRGRGDCAFTEREGGGVGRGLWRPFWACAEEVVEVDGEVERGRRVLVLSMVR